MLELLITGECDPNVYDFSEEYTLLSDFYKNKKHQAFKMLVETCEKKININETNKIDNTTIFGLLLYHCNPGYALKEQNQPDIKL